VLPLCGDTVYTLIRSGDLEIARPGCDGDLLIRRSIQRVRGDPQRSLSGVALCVMILVDGLIVDRVAVSVAVSSWVRSQSHSVGHSPQSCVAGPGSFK
jgi:hypothetical protein